MTEPGPAPPPVPGHRLTRRLSRAGGPTEVWAAESAAGDPVAVKLLTPLGRTREDQGIRFAQEAELLRSLGGKHGVVRAIGTIPEPPAILLELCAGSLDQSIEPGGGAPAAEAIARARQACEQVGDALRWLHRNGVIHRDVKPSNILVRGDGTLALADLGVAARGIPPAGLPPGWIEEAVGTLGYVAPAVLRDLAAAGPAADFYGLAASVYELLTGRLPYEFGMAESEAALAVRIRAGEPPIPLGARRSDLPADLVELVDRWLRG